MLKNKNNSGHTKQIQENPNHTDSLNSNQTLWEACLNFLKTKLSEPNYQLMINTVHFKSLHESILSLELDNMNSQKWLKDTCEPLILEFLNLQNQTNVLIYYLQKEKQENDKQLNLFKNPSIKKKQNKTILLMKNLVFLNLSLVITTDLHTQQHKRSQENQLKLIIHYLYMDQ